MTPKISVLMTVYRSNEYYLYESIKSILLQTYNNFEFIIVIESGTPQSIVKMIESFSNHDRRIIPIINSKKLGFVASLNLGMGLAKGKYIARMDDDDISRQDRFLKQFHFMECNQDVVVCGTWQSTVTPFRVYIIKKPVHHDQIKSRLIFGCEIAHASVFLRTEVFKKNGWRYAEGFIGEDFELWHRIIDHAKFANLPEPLIYHRAGFGSMSCEKQDLLRREIRVFAKNKIEKMDISVNIDDNLIDGWRTPVSLNMESKSEFIERGKLFFGNLKNRNIELEIYEIKSFNEMIEDRIKWLHNSTEKKNIS